MCLEMCVCMCLCMCVCVCVCEGRGSDKHGVYLRFMKKCAGAVHTIWYVHTNWYDHQMIRTVILFAPYNLVLMLRQILHPWSSKAISNKLYTASSSAGFPVPEVYACKVLTNKRAPCTSTIPRAEASRSLGHIHWGNRRLCYRLWLCYRYRIFIHHGFFPGVC